MLSEYMTQIDRLAVLSEELSENSKLKSSPDATEEQKQALNKRYDECTSELQTVINAVHPVREQHGLQLDRTAVWLLCKRNERAAYDRFRDGVEFRNFLLSESGIEWPGCPAWRSIA